MMRLRLALLSVSLLAAAPQVSDAQWPINGAPICVAENNQRYPQVVSDGTGGAIVIWFDFRSGTSWDIYGQHVLASGAVDPAWTANGTPLCDAPDHQTYPQITSDGAGGAIVTWQDRRSGPSADIYAQHALATGVADPAWPANGAMVCNAADNQTYPLIVSDGAGGAIVAWQDYRSLTNFDIYAQHVLASGAVDPAWTTNGALLCNAANNQFVPTILSDGVGGAFVSWYDYRSGSDYDIYAQHVFASGAVDPGWTANGALLCGAPGDQVNPKMISDGAGGAIISWQDQRSGASADIYAQHLLASGIVDPAWPANGTLLCGAADKQIYPQLVSDGAGGAIVTWQDYRSLTEFDTYAHRVLASGIVDPSWPADGALLCGAAGTQDYPQIISDGAGGAIATWCDGRGADGNVYAQHVLASGVADPSWTADGTLLCSAAGNQDYPVLVSDDAGGAIVAWFDHRGGATSDIYAQRVYGSGDVAAAASGIVKPLAACVPHPNPAHAGTTISFDLVTAQAVSVSIYDAAGQLVRTLARNRVLPPGRGNLVWDGRSDRGVRVSAGLYFIRVRAGTASIVGSVAVLR